MRGKPTRTGRVVVDLDRLAEDALAELGYQEAGLARDRRAADRACEMADEARRDAWVVDDGALAGRDLPRIEAADGPLARLAPDLGREAELGAMRLDLAFVVTLHGGAFAGDRRGGQAEARGEIGAGETMRGRQHQPA